MIIYGYVIFTDFTTDKRTDNSKWGEGNVIFA